MTCKRHPLVTGHRLCPVCLLEEALASGPTHTDRPRVPGVSDDTPVRRLTIQVRLGQSASASVFLVRQDEPAAGLLRLKVWHTTAPDDFLDRFAALRRAIDGAAESFIVSPVAACVDEAGRPSVLSDFKQGVPLLDAVRSGALTPSAATALVLRLAEMMVRLHDRGLAHGSLVPGNVIVPPDSQSTFLVDFGLSCLFKPSNPADHIAADRADLKRLSGALGASGDSTLTSRV